MDDVFKLVLAITVLACIICCTIGHYTGREAAFARLKKVGIDHIEECHNTQSNWFEIVWISGKAK